MVPATNFQQHRTLSLPLQKLGLNYKSAKSVYLKSKLSVRSILRQSKNEEIRRFYNLTSANNVRADSLVNATMTTTQILKTSKFLQKLSVPSTNRPQKITGKTS